MHYSISKSQKLKVDGLILNNIITSVYQTVVAAFTECIEHVSPLASECSEEATIYNHYKAVLTVQADIYIM